MTARELMTPDVVTVSPSLEIGAAARLLSRLGISGAPVVSASGELLGVVSQTDLARFLGQAPEAAWGLEPSDDPGLACENGRAREPISSLMTVGAVTCDEDASEEELAELMLGRRVHRLVVTKKGRLCGIVSAMDLLRALMRRTAAGSDGKNVA